MGYIEEQQKFFEQKQNNETINKIQNTNARKEKEAQKRHKKLIFTKAKWLLYDELRAKSDTLTDLNALLYDEKLKNKIIDNIFVELSKLYANFKDETNEDLNYYLLEIYNTQATKIISIKTKEKKELERQQKALKQALLQLQLQKQIEETNKLAEEQAKRQKRENNVAILEKIFAILFNPLVAIPLIIFGIIITILINVFNLGFFAAIGFTILGIFILLILI